MPSNNPLLILKEGIKAVPAVKYALGIAGVASALALASAFFSSKQAAFLGAAAMLILMVMLVIFSSATALTRGQMKYPALVLTWTILIVFVSSTLLITSSVFFDSPKSFPKLMEDLLGSERLPSIIEKKSNLNQESFLQAKKHRKVKHPLEDKVKLLNKIIGVYVDNAQGVIAIVGKLSLSNIAVPLQLEDVAFLLKWADGARLPFGCAWEPNEGNFAIRYFGGIADKHIGYILFSADRILKEYSFGQRIDGQRIQNFFESYIDLVIHSEKNNEMGQPTLGRFWFESNLIIRVDPTNTLALLDGHGVYVRTVVMEWRDGRYVESADPKNFAAQEFAINFTQKYNLLSQIEPILSAFARISQLSFLSEWISKNTNVKKIPWLDRFAEKEHPTPKRINGITRKIEYRENTVDGIQTQAIAISGGVSLGHRFQTVIDSNNEIVLLEKALRKMLIGKEVGDIVELQLCGEICVAIVLVASN